MSMSNLERALGLIESHPELADFVGPRPEPLIRKAERSLGMRFPPTYMRFLEQLGCGDFAGVEIYGIVDDNFSKSSVPNGIWLTLDLRQTANLPHSYIVVYATGDGAYYALDTSRSDHMGENPVVMWFPGWSPSGGEAVQVASDFGQFLHTELATALQAN